MKENIAITPQTKIRQLIDAYPELEEKLIELAPAFSKLKNPVLRNTVARVTSLHQAAIIGNVEIDVLVNHLRKAIGQPATENGTSTGEMKPADLPDWLEMNKIALTIDARPMLEQGHHPIHEVFKGLKEMEKGEILKLITGFIPQPLIDKALEMGHKSYTTENAKAEFFTYFFKT